jgi:hypothetical protein
MQETGFSTVRGGRVDWLALKLSRFCSRVCLKFGGLGPLSWSVVFASTHVSVCVLDAWYRVQLTCPSESWRQGTIETE